MNQNILQALRAKYPTEYILTTTLDGQTTSKVVLHCETRALAEQRRQEFLLDTRAAHPQSDATIHPPLAGRPHECEDQAAGCRHAQVRAERIVDLLVADVARANTATQKNLGKASARLWAIVDHEGLWPQVREEFARRYPPIEIIRRPEEERAATEVLVQVADHLAVKAGQSRLEHAHPITQNPAPCRRCLVVRLWGGARKLRDSMAARATAAGKTWGRGSSC